MYPLLKYHYSVYNEQNNVDPEHVKSCKVYT